MDRGQHRRTLVQPFLVLFVAPVLGGDRSKQGWTRRLGPAQLVCLVRRHGYCVKLEGGRHKGH
jgi:hypothetical protein